MTAYDKLMSFQRETGALAQVAGRLGWDQEVMMPHGASEQRSEEMAVMESILHARRTDPRVGEWLNAVDDGALDEEGTAHLRHIRRSYERGLRVPAKLATDIARITSRAHRIWAEARADDDFAAFAPVLKEVVRLKREEGAALAAGGEAYDALLDDYEPGATAAQLSGMFGALRPRLVALRQAVLDRPQPAALQGTFDEQAQMMLSQTVARTFGYEMARGRIDKAVHPFSSGSGDDVRITTRTNALDPFNCLYSTIHEVGHAAYEQSIRGSYRFTPLGQGVSMGVHESQSRIYENQLGRSRAFTSWLFSRMTELFGDLGLDGPDAFYAAVNRVQNGFIRTEADEVQYNLHVLLRFDLEQALIAGTLEVDDLEVAWNERFLSDFGFPVDKPSDGVLQDVHWSAGLFGYFPTYSLGNVYAGCLHKALRAAAPDLDSQMAAGDLAAATAWLSENVQQYGGLYEPRDVITRACGEAPSEAPLLDYLEAKFGAIYGL
ncbi:MAG: carboxypeptidase M32 [Yangia sp.]|nr:carboxypeptidase M32 [Salipiger sp.]